MENTGSFDLKFEIEKLKNVPGKERAVDLKYLVNYVKNKEGENGLQQVLDKLNNLGYQLPDLKNMPNMEWFPISTINIFYLVAIKEFGWGPEETFEMGRKAISYSITFRLFVKYFLSIRKTFEKSAANWRRYYTVGELKFSEYNEENKRVVLRLYDFKVHPYTCIYLAGLISVIVETAVGGKVKINETKCQFNNDPYHEYTITWK